MADQRLPRLTSLGKMTWEISRRKLDQVHCSAPWAGKEATKRPRKITREQKRRRDQRREEMKAWAGGWLAMSQRNMPK